MHFGGILCLKRFLCHDYAHQTRPRSCGRAASGERRRDKGRLPQPDARSRKQAKFATNCYQLLLSCGSSLLSEWAQRAAGRRRRRRRRARAAPWRPRVGGGPAAVGLAKSSLCVASRQTACFHKEDSSSSTSRWQGGNQGLGSDGRRPGPARLHAPRSQPRYVLPFPRHHTSVAPLLML